MFENVNIRRKFHGNVLVFREVKVTSLGKKKLNKRGKPQKSSVFNDSVI